MTDFKYGDRVEMNLGDDIIVHGEVTVIRESSCKVMWDEYELLDYDYYPKEDLRLISKNETP